MIIILMHSEEASDSHDSWLYTVLSVMMTIMPVVMVEKLLATSSCA